MHLTQPAEVASGVRPERYPQRRSERRPEPARSTSRTSGDGEDVRERGPGKGPRKRPVERPEGAGTGADSYQLRLFPPAPPVAPSEAPGAGPLRVHLLLHDTAVYRAAWVAVSGQPAVQVVSTVSATSVEADVRVEAVDPSDDRPAEGNPRADLRGAVRLLAVVPDDTDEALAAALSRGAWAAVREADIPLRLVFDLLAIGRGECPILRVAAGRAPLAAALVGRYLQDGERGLSGPRQPSPLTERETAILEAIAQGQTSAAIARRLGIGIQTVKNHVAQVLLKAGARTRAQAVRVADRHGWLPNDS